MCESILDVGCGTGCFTILFERYAPTIGIDFSEKMLSVNPASTVKQMDATQLKFEDDSFDLVFCSQLLHHINNPMDVIREMRRVSKKYVVIIEPNRNNPLNLLFALAVPEERLTMRSSSQFLEDCASKAKLKIAGLFAHGVILPNRLPLSWLSLTKNSRKESLWG